MAAHSSPKSSIWTRFSAKQLGAGAAALLVVIGVVLGVTLSSGPKPKRAAAKTTTTTTTTASTSSSSSSTTTTLPFYSGIRCPLTDVPAPKGGVPKRPALGVKIGNEPDGARPQSGLNEADIVYDTPAEGFIMRYIAVFQCNSATSIGPVRSVRYVDWHIMRQFIDPILTFAGGIDPDVNTVMGLGWLKPANLLEGAQNAGIRLTTRYAPDNLYTSTSALWALYPSAKKAPAPVFKYAPTLPAGSSPVASLAINFSAGTDVLWKWDPKGHDFVHTYGGATDVDTLTGAPVTTTNIFVQVVNYAFGPYVESPGGSGDVESNTLGTGSGYILRNGRSIPVTWHRPELIDPTTFTSPSGKPVGLAPGRTWVEIVPDTTANAAGNLVLTK